MVTLDKLLELAELEGIEIVYYPMPKTLKGYAISNGDRGTIFINSRLQGKTAELKTILAEELGHFFTASGCAVLYAETFRAGNIAEMRKREHQGQSWQAQCLAPLWMIQRAYEAGVTEVWQLAEYLEVTQKFIWDRLNSGDVYHLQLRMEKMGSGR